MLTICQVGILLRGLNFTSTPLKNNIKRKGDIHNFTCKLWLIEYFDNSNNRQKSQKDDTHESFVKETGKFYQPRNRYKDLNRQIDFLNKLDLADTNKTCKTNE